jgi:hypothetical protein
VHRQVSPLASCISEDVEGILMGAGDLVPPSASAAAIIQERNSQRAIPCGVSPGKG